MEISEVFDIKKGDVVSITGTGGKTTTMMALSKDLKKKGRVLITTSTKIGVKSKDDVDYQFLSFSEYEKIEREKISVCLGEKLENSNKLASVSEENLKKIKADFDYILIEADGSRNLPLKMWKSYEPVIYSISTKAIGVFSVKTFGKKIEESFIYNFSEFREKIDEEYVNADVFYKLISDKDGIFKGFEGEKIIFFNQADTETEIERTYELIRILKKRLSEIEFVYGSVRYENILKY